MHTISVRDKFTSFLSLAPPSEDDGYDIYHNYVIEISISGDTLSDDGYLFDINDLQEILAEEVDRWDGILLNELPEFEDKNPTLEVFAQVACVRIVAQIETDGLHELKVTLWESEVDPPPGPSASYAIDLRG